MTKKEMIDLVIKEFIKDKELIKRNLMEYTDNVNIDIKDKNCKVSINIKWEVESNE